MRNSRRFIVAAKCLELLEDVRTKLTALEMNHEANILQGVKEAVLRNIEDEVYRRRAGCYTGSEEELIVAE